MQNRHHGARSANMLFRSSREVWYLRSSNTSLLPYHISSRHKSLLQVFRSSRATARRLALIRPAMPRLNPNEAFREALEF